MAVLVNDTNFTTATWQAYQSNIVAEIGTVDGESTVWVGLRGHSWQSAQTWHGVTITRDTVPPQLFITQPVTNLTVQPVLQLHGYANEPLLMVRCDLTNATGLQSNLVGYITRQHLDTNTLRYTTNWFQGYDLGLETNLNALTIRVTDLAGNETSTNLSLTLDYSGDTNAPTITVTWPAENTLVAGESFTLRGQLDDPTASVVVELGASHYNGTVGRDGEFFVPEVPLVAPTNSLSVIATDAAGNARTNTLPVRQSAETLTIDPLTPSQLAGPTVTVSGTVGVSGQNVWVNGIAATVSGNTWTANVPTPSDNVAHFDVQTGDTFENATAAQNLSLESPPQVRPVSYMEKYSYWRVVTGGSWIGTFSSTAARRQEWTRGLGGTSQQTSSSDSAPTCVAAVNWPEAWPDGQTFAGNSFCYPAYTETTVLPWQNSLLHYSQSRSDSDVVDWWSERDSVSREARTALELVVGGTAGAGQMRLVRLVASAVAYAVEQNFAEGYNAIYELDNFETAAGASLPVSALRIMGRPLEPTPTNSNVGELYVSLPAGSTNDLPVEVIGLDTYSFTVWAEAIHAVLLVDANRDGVINELDRELNPASNPFRFWINDDNDSGDTGGDDIAGQPDVTSNVFNEPEAADYHTATSSGIGVVDGTRDLVDFFPVYLDITNLLTLLPPGDTVHYKLKQQNDAVNVIFTGVNQANALDYQTDHDLAQDIIARTTRKVSNSGITLPAEFLLEMAAGSNGVILVEGRAATTNPLRLVVEKEGVSVVELALPLRIGGVELMFRHLNLNYAASGGSNEVPTRATAPNEPPTNGKNFVFMHGYNVNQESARGWGAEIFKRMYWAGSRARFYAVSWRGYETQIDEPISISYNLQTNIVHAFETAPVLANFLNNLPGETAVAGHSLGNMLASAAITRFGGAPAKYFMIDGAVAMEAFDPDSITQVDMVNQHWNDYYLSFPAPDDDYLFASEWHQLFPANDPRSQLTWRGVFTNWGNTAVYNFYSSGEEVMGNIPANQGNDFNIPDTAEFPWGCQEKLKGRMPVEFLGSTVGGWGFNQEVLDGYGTWNGEPPEWEGISPATAHNTPPSQLVTKPFFKKSPAELFSTNSTTAQNFAQQHYYDLLARVIPARTFGIGANPIGSDVTGFEESTDMQSLKTGWTTSRGTDTRWRHSDCRDMAYVYTHRLFEEIINLGELK